MSNSLNRTFRVIWSAATNTWVAVSELAKSNGKQKSVKRVRRGFAMLAVMASGAGITAPPAPSQLPIGGVVTIGHASIAASGGTMTINQVDPKVAINWNSFDIGSSATVNFNQPSASSVALNRVDSTSPSQIFGSLNANGQVYLINSAGIYFSPGANVNVGGIVATTHQMSDADFANGSTTFSRNGSTGSVVNEGVIKSGIGGYIALLAPEVRNSGVLIAQQGTVALASGEAITLNFGPLSTLDSLTVTPSQMKALVENRYIIQAPGGLVILSAKAVNQLAGSVINSGTIQADGVVSAGGKILLEASSSIIQTGVLSANAASNTINNGGVIKIVADLSNPNSRTYVNGSISAKGGDLGGDGGEIETSASNVVIGTATVVSTTAPHGNTGTWLIDPHDFTIGPSGSSALTGAGKSDIDGTTLSNQLDANNVTILSSQGAAASGSGDINVNGAVNWNANQLTLTAAHSININAQMTLSALPSGSKLPSSSLVMNTSTANGGDAAISGGSVNVGAGGGGSYVC